MTKVYLAATSKMSWGRGSEPWEAIAIAVSHGKGADKIMVFEITLPEGGSMNDVLVNEMGHIVAPKGSEVEDLYDWSDCKPITSALIEFLEVIESFADK